MLLKKTLALVLFTSVFVNFPALAKDGVKNYSNTQKDEIRGKFYGNVKSFDLKVPSTWIIKGKQVLVEQNTKIDQEDGKIVVNSFVKVEGYYKDNKFIATEIELISEKYNKSRKHNNIKAKFYGNVKSFDLKVPSTWVIKGKQVLVDQNTKIDQEDGKIEVNSFVKVEGYFKDNKFIATEIEISKNKFNKMKNEMKAKFYGNVKSFDLKVPSTWVIKGKQVLVDQNTKIDQEDGKIEVNSFVKVEGYFKDNKFIATEIEFSKRGQ